MKVVQYSWLLKLRCVLELSTAHNLGRVALAVPVAPSPIAGATSALFGGCFLLSFLLGHGEDLNPVLPSMDSYWFGDSTPFLDMAFACSDVSFALILFTQTFLAPTDLIPPGLFKAQRQIHSLLPFAVLLGPTLSLTS